MNRSPSTEGSANQSIPNGWAESLLGELLREPLRNGHSAIASKDDTGIRTLTLTAVTRGDFSEVNTKLTIADANKVTDLWLEPGDILIQRSNTPELVGTARLYAGERKYAIFPDLLIRVRLFSGIVPKLVEAFLQTTEARKYFRRAAQGIAGSMPKISQGTIEALVLPVAPVPEQQRIVEAIDSYFTRLDDAVATLERVERNLKRYRASVLKSAVEGRLVPTEAALARQEGRDYEPASVLLERILAERRQCWGESGKKGKYQEPTPPEVANLPDLPEGWCWATMPQLGELNRGKSKHRPRNDPRLLGGPYPFIQTGDVHHSECFIETYETTYSEFGLAQSRLWPKGTLCITIAANIAETGILDFSACFPDSVVGFLQEDSTLTRYVELFLRTARDQLRQYAPATAQKNINLQVLSEVAVPLPPTVEQERIVNEIDKHMSVARHLERTIEMGSVRATRLRQSVLKWAFEGKLADQDPSDEPASVLLERIKAERETARPAKTAPPPRNAGKKKRA